MTSWNAQLYTTLPPFEPSERGFSSFGALNGMVYRFCTYNSGPCFREKSEQQFSVPFDLKAAQKENGNGLVNVM